MKIVIFLFSNLKPRRPPGGFPKLYFSLKFWLSFKKCWKNDNIAHLKIGAYTLFDERYVTKPKIFSKWGRWIILFPAEMFLFSNLKPRMPPEDLFEFANFVFFFLKFLKHFIISYQYRASGSLLGLRFEKTSQFHWKRNHPIIFFWTEFKFVSPQTSEKLRF